MEPASDWLDGYTRSAWARMAQHWIVTRGLLPQTTLNWSFEVEANWLETRHDSPRIPTHDHTRRPSEAAWMWTIKLFALHAPATQAEGK